MLDIGFYEVFVRRDFFSDMLILNILCLERGGVEAFMRWTSTSDGLTEFIEDFQDVRISVLMCHREMLVHHKAKAFSYALIGGLPHFGSGKHIRRVRVLPCSRVLMGLQQSGFQLSATSA